MEGTTKPPSVNAAVRLLWLSLAVGLVMVLISEKGRDALYGVPGYVLSALLFLKIQAGRNWARITFLVVFLLFFLMLGVDLLKVAHLPSGGPGWREAMDELPVFTAAFLMTSLQACALLLLLRKPANDWFRRDKRNDRGKPN